MSTPVRVLIIDDNTGVLQDYRKVLATKKTNLTLEELETELFGEAAIETSPVLQCIVDTALQGAEGVDNFRQAMEKQPYDIVFVDMRMPPGWDGLRTIKEIWKLEPEQFVVLCTAYSDYSFEALTRELGVNPNFQIIHKPFEPEEIQQAVHSAAARISELGRRDRRLANELRQAIRTGELSLQFQPIVRLADDAVTGFECLCRWSRNGKAVFSPEVFISIAEQRGLIEELGLWVAESAMKAAAELIPFASSKEFMVNFNVSPLQLKPSIVSKLQKLADDYRINRSQIGLEITESSLLPESPEAILTAVELRSSGFRVLMDDFGAGFSCLHSLAKGPFDTIKIDKRFCDEMVVDESAAAVVKSIASVIHSLGRRCVVEGVETAAHKAKLIDAGVLYGQGYLFSKPVDLAQAKELLCSGLLNVA